jgi:hypothetical protein
MMIGSFDEREVEALVLALRYWRAHRGNGRMRRGDAPLTNSDIELLLAKLRSGTMTSLTPDDVIPPFLLR